MCLSIKAHYLALSQRVSVESVSFCLFVFFLSCHFTDMVKKLLPIEFLPSVTSPKCVTFMTKSCILLFSYMSI